MEKSSLFVCIDVAIMDKDLKTILKEEIDRRGLKVPAAAKELGIPKDRIYAWYRDGTQPKDADSKKINKWLNGEISNQPKGHYFTADQLFHMYMKAMERQDGIMESQLTLLRSIEGKMAREETQARIEASSIESLAGILSMSQRQKQAIAEFRKDFEELRSQDSQPRGSGRKSRESDGAGEKRGKT